MRLFIFLIQVFIISLSGVMQPGPVTAATIAMGVRSRYAGTFIALGHAIIEFPLMVLIMLGMDKLLKSTNIQMAVSLAGGLFLLVMATQMITSSNAAQNWQAKYTKTRPVMTGLILSASNPYFLLWWATIGLALATNARQLGIWAFGLFAIVHWLCDCTWLQALSWASFKGSNFLGGRSRRIVVLVCSLALFFFAMLFIYRALNTLVRLF